MSPPKTNILSLDPNDFPIDIAEMGGAQFEPESFTIDNLRKQFRDLARPNRFKVIIYPPDIIAMEYDIDYIGAIVKKANMPGIEINEWVYEKAGKKLHIPTHTEFENLSITFHNDIQEVSDYNMRELILRWQRLAIMNWGDNIMGPPILSLQGKVFVIQYDGGNKPINGVGFTNCWPKKINNIDFDHEFDSKTSDFTVEFVYTEQIIMTTYV